MVPLDARLALESLGRLPLLGRGAEAEVRLGSYAGLRAVYKLRPPKPYRHPRLDLSIRSGRTRREARLTLRARRGGAPAPAVLAAYPSLGLIVFEYVEGTLLREALRSSPQEAPRLLRLAGEVLAALHRARVSHGDYTTSNLIVTPSGGLVVIDFGLAEPDPGVEEMAVDVHLFRRSLESAHAHLAGPGYEAFLDGYKHAMGGGAGPIIRRAEEIRLMGRYVAERRSVWGSTA
ncbi:MAG: Kae1-associated kinase Bud32 [Desulfurococcales archaeon]|nr:Kae1-associated kinase Bud32 [Desulfurococcales archaeon]